MILTVHPDCGDCLNPGTMTLSGAPAKYFQALRQGTREDHNWSFRSLAEDELFRSGICSYHVARMILHIECAARRIPMQPPTRTARRKELAMFLELRMALICDAIVPQGSTTEFLQQRPHLELVEEVAA